MDAQIAKWLHDKIMFENWVTQRDAVREIEEKFGEEYIYTNVNGNPAISRGVIKEFARLKGDNIVWNRSTFEWHVKTDADRELERIEAELPKFDSDIFGEFDAKTK